MVPVLTKLTLTGRLNSVLQVLYQFLWGVLIWVLEKLLLTDENIHRHLTQLDQEADELERAEASPQQLPHLQVTEMKDKKLTINIKPNGLKDEADEYDPPSSADIEVVHKRAPPKLHSILKQRTLSESSDDNTCSSSSCSNGESPRSSEDSLSPDALSKKSVTFNSHIDSATYKKNTAPTSMKTALKSRRRRARKKEEKEEKKANGRRRRNSGSDYSSGEEMTSSDSVGATVGNDKEDREAEEEVEEVEEEEKEEKEKYFEQISEDAEGENAERKKEEVNTSVSVKGSVLAGKDHQDFRTSVDKGEKKVNKRVNEKKKKKLVEELKTAAKDKSCDAAEDKACEADSDDDIELDGRTITNSGGHSVNECGEHARSESVQSGSSTASCDRGDGKEGKPDLDDVVDDSCQNGDVPIADTDAQDSKTSQDAKEPPMIQELSESEGTADPGSDKGGKSGKEDVHSVSWEEKGSVVDPFGDDHKTKCAFDFSNSVIYDLDID